MKKLLMFLPLVILIGACNSGENGGSMSSESGDLTTFIDSASYAQGLMMGEQIKKLQINDDEPIFSSSAMKMGIDDALAGKEGLFDEEVSMEILTKFQADIQANTQKKQESEGIENRKIGEAFLAENATKDGVMSTASGLQYKVLEPGSGASPTAQDRVEVHYEGRLIDGTVFDSSYERGAPAKFALTAVIKGWTEGVQLMKVGSKYQFYIPADLAYGNQGSPPDIAPGSTLVFDVELLSINPSPN